MKLISDIINELVDADKSITAPLLKTKVLASRLKNVELLTWANCELGGYGNFPIPGYRKTVANLIGNYLNGYAQFNHQVLPTPGFSNDIAEQMRILEFSDSISTLESMANEKKTSEIGHIFPAEIIAVWQRNIRRVGNPNFQLLSANKTVSITVVFQIISAVRSKLLDFMLKLDDEFGNLTEIDDLKNNNQKITTIMSQTIITNTGDGNILNAGDSSKIEANITINKGDKNALAEKLKESGIENADIDELLAILDIEKSMHNGKFGAKTNSWIKKMIGKALEGSWQVGVGAGGTLLAEAIQAFLG